MWFHNRDCARFDSTMLRHRPSYRVVSEMSFYTIDLWDLMKSSDDDFSIFPIVVVVRRHSNEKKKFPSFIVDEGKRMAMDWIREERAQNVTDHKLILPFNSIFNIVQSWEPKKKSSRIDKVIKAINFQTQFCFKKFSPAFLASCLCQFPCWYNIKKRYNFADISHPPNSNGKHISVTISMRWFRVCRAIFYSHSLFFSQQTALIVKVRIQMTAKNLHGDE